MTDQAVGYLLQEDQGTQSAIGRTVPSPIPLQTLPTFAFRFASLRRDASALTSQIGTDHRETEELTLEHLSAAYRRDSVVEVLNKLSGGWGVGWSDIARVVGVSVQAVRKWRQGAPTSPDHCVSLSRFAALLERLENHGIKEPANWLELPVVPGYTPRHIDLYVAGCTGVLLDLAQGLLDSAAALGECAPDWRNSLVREHETFEAEDGNLAIRRRRG